ncbi:ribonuclease H-like domain-containing protein [Tanacetum coccineum]
MIGHTNERCYELIGYPLGFKRVVNPIKQTCFKKKFNANIDVKTNDKQQSAASQTSSSFTADQMKKLPSLINETHSGSIHANMADITIGHPNGTLDTISHIGNLKRTINVMLYDHLVVPSYCVLGNVNMVVSFNVSKSIWHNRLGHPAYQVLAVLKKDLNISRSSSVSACEVCHRAKQTRESFPLSDHRYKKIGELVHLNF